MTIKIAQAEDIQKLLDDLSVQKEQLTQLKNSLETQSTEFKAELERYQKEFTNFQTEIKTHLGNTTSDAASISTTLSNARQSETDIAKIKNEIASIKSVYDTNVNQYSTLIDEIEKSSATINTNIEREKDELVGLRKKLNEEQVKITKILGDANRASMAQSFLERKRELNSPIDNSAKWRNWGLVLMALMVLVIIWNEWSQSSFDYVRFLSRLPLVSPLVWLVWVNSQRNAHLIRIQEEYAHKASVALAFEGYQRKVDETQDPDIKKLLLELSVANLGENPVHLFDKQVKSSPVDDSVLSRIIEKFFPKKKEEK